MKRTSLSLVAIISLFLFSCQKEDSIGEQKAEAELKGDWKFLNFDLDAVTSSETIGGDIGNIKSEFITNYLTENEAGTISFSDNQIFSHDLAYDVTGSILMNTYMDDDLIMNFDSTLNIPMGPSNSTTDYVRVTEDSIYCPNGSFIQIEGVEGVEQSKPGGMKLKFEGDKLILTITQKDVQTITEEGITQEQKSDIKMIATLQRN
ncbi:MAG: hypothetical protein JNK79_04170 [Chitinophagaceae bacterium]|nr:hypothetical protein [Chitinophagaceae bacterium]